MAMFNLFNINEHLDGDEKVVKFFRPSRLGYLFQYILIVIIFLWGLIMKIYWWNDYRVSAAFGRLFTTIALIVAIIWFIRVEYRTWSRRYALTNERAMYSCGIFNETYRSAQYKYVTDIGFEQSLWDKIMNTGTLKIDTAGTDYDEIRFRKIRYPHEIKKMINDMQGTHLKGPKPLRITKNAKDEDDE